MRGDNELIKGEYVKFRLQLMQNGVDVVMINKAWDFAVLAHHGQRRKTGEPFVMHALEVGKKLFEWNLDTQTIVAGILHETQGQ